MKTVPLPSLLFLAALAATFAGCASTKSQPPALVRSPEAGGTEAETFDRLKAAYADAMKVKDYPAARIARDRMIHTGRREIDIWYADLETQLYEQRAGFNTLADFTELGLAGAAALTHGEEAKTVLATVLTVVKGTRLSFDKNWFREKATETLINTMRSGRNAVLAEIIKKATANSAEQYTFEEAQGDLVAYYQAGTIPSALVALAASSGQAVEQSKDEVKRANEPRYEALYSATEEDVVTTKEIRAIAQKLDESQSRAVLGALAVPVPENATAEQIAELINAQVRKLATASKEEQAKIRQAFVAATPKPATP